MTTTTKKLIIAIILLINLTIILVLFIDLTIILFKVHEENSEQIHQTTIGHPNELDVVMTYYNPVESQCNADPLHTADMSYIDTLALKTSQIHWIAISRDLLEFFKFGDTVRILTDNPNDNWINQYRWVIHDVMDSRYTKSIDLLLPLNAKVGKREVKLVWGLKE